MYAKVFSQIFDSSIAADHEVRHVFMDLLVLADPDGVVDMTRDAIARRTNIPMELLLRALSILSAPDASSRSDHEDGRRIKLIDDHRDWGWKIINYEHYRDIRDEEGRRRYFREYQRQRRKQLLNPVKDKSHLLKKVTSERQRKRYTDPETEGKAADAARPSLGGGASIVSSPKSELRPPAGTSPNSARPPSKVPLNEEEWLQGLESDPTYAGINVRQELGKMNRWCAVNQKQPTPRRFINWLNRTDKPIQAAIGQPSKTASTNVPKSDDPSLY